ncbi:MAG: carboxylesterase family protein [Pirellulaceae bacterium]
MRGFLRCRTCTWLAWGLLASVAGGWGPSSAWAEVITLKSGLQLEGRLTRVSSLNENPLIAQSAGNVEVSKIVLVDDDLRRTFVSSNQVRTDGIAPDADVTLARIDIPKRVAKGSRRIGMVGPIIEVTPFDEYGNRVFSMQGREGRIDVIQGITRITPFYAQVEGLLVKDAYEWDMRINTASIPRETLSHVLLRHINQADSNERLRVVQLYIQAERYRDALVELDRVMSDFPDLKDLENERTRLRQLVAADVIREIELRRGAGQHQQVMLLLKSFPEKDVAGELLLKVGALLGEYTRLQERGDKALLLIAGHVQELAGHKGKVQIDRITQEIHNELNFNNLDRLADYLRLADDEKLTADQKLSLAISGWLLGQGAGTENLAESLSLVEVRDAVRDYLTSEHQVERDEILQRLNELEGGSPAHLAKLIATMKPPREIQIPEEGVAGLVERSIPGVGDEPEFRYLVQIPPEYDPSRRYPCIVTLHGSGTNPHDQIDWWAGPWDGEKNLRTGQATRRGYIVVAPLWAPPNQTKYEYSLREHAAVLGALRDACRHLSIDTDRVFLSGHSMGGDAAWDIGLAHPDLWAGILPVVATADKYVSRYWKNAKGLPMYFVAGQLDGNKIAANARDLDRYMKYAGFDAIYVEYQGRGHEHFHDEILRMFQWMELNVRNFARKEFQVVSMRPWDQFFWWVELEDIPERFVVLPINWPQPKTKDAETEAQITQGNTIRIKTPSEHVTIWLSPELVDFEKKISVGRDRVDITPANDVLLEDVRTRGDRYHPFWAKYSPPSGRR